MLSDHRDSVSGGKASRSTWPRLAAVTAAVGVLAPGCSPSSTGHVVGGGSSVSAAVQVTIDPARTYQVIQGFEASNRVGDDPHVSNAPRTNIPPSPRVEIITRLYKDLGLTRVRLVLDGGIEPVNDNDDPFVFDWSKFNFEWKHNDAHVAFVRDAVSSSRFPLVLEKWMTEHNPDEYVEWAMAILTRWRQLGQEPRSFSVFNEPGNRDCRPSTADVRAIQKLAVTHGIPIWMSEVSESHFQDYGGAITWAMTIHALISEYGVGAVDYMWGFFGSHDVGHGLIGVQFTDGEYRSYTLTPAHYVTGDFSRFVRPGYVRVNVRSEDPHVLVSAHTGAGSLVIVVINSGARFQAGQLPASHGFCVRLAIRGGDDPGRAVEGHAPNPRGGWDL